VLVHDDAVIAFEAGLARQRIDWCDADRDEHEIRRDVAAVGEPHRGNPLFADRDGVLGARAGRGIRADERMQLHAAANIHVAPHVLGFVEARNHR
jgi:NADPH-dependent 2,4-dienoyl-CoA reductase/sulfur reductase-like enzyme